MKYLLQILCSVILCFAASDWAVAADVEGGRHQYKEKCNSADNGQCNIEKRGWCGKRKGDWYGARRPVASLDDARKQLVKYFFGQQLTVAEVVDKPWRFEADVLDNCGKVVDRVMIDKRSGRVRSIY